MQLVLEGDFSETSLGYGLADSISQKICYPSERPPGPGEGAELAGRPRTGTVCPALNGVPPAPLGVWDGPSPQLTGGSSA